MGPADRHSQPSNVHEIASHIDQKNRHLNFHIPAIRLRCFVSLRICFRVTTFLINLLVFVIVIALVSRSQIFQWHLHNMFMTVASPSLRKYNSGRNRRTQWWKWNRNINTIRRKGTEKEAETRGHGCRWRITSGLIGGSGNGSF